MDPSAVTLPERAKELWDASYDVTKQDNLWGDPPVPFCAGAAAQFSAHGAARVLDLPCGDGRNLAVLARQVAMVVGADSSPRALALAQKAIDKAALGNVILTEADIFRSGFPDGAFDAILCCDVLGHLTDPARALMELLRICRPGGLVVANVFAMDDSTRGSNMTRIDGEEYIYDDRFYFRFYNRDEVESLLKAMDCEVESVILAAWTEPPHEGYREYEHDHASWVATLWKR